MILRSDPLGLSKPTTGLSLLEALIALAILAMVMGLSASAFRGPSPTLQLQKQTAELIAAASVLRQRAIRENKTLIMETDTTCNQTDKHINFFSNGTASGPDLCLSVKEKHLRLSLNALTGRFSQVLR